MKWNLGFAALVLLAACRPAEPPAPAAIAVDSTAVGGLQDVSWTLTWLAGQPVTVTTDRPAPTLVLNGSERRATGNTGCNEFSGEFELDGALLRFGPLIATRRACTDPVLNQRESLLLQALTEARSWRVTEGSLSIAGTTGQLARFERDSVTPD